MDVKKYGFKNEDKMRSQAEVLENIREIQKDGATRSQQMASEIKEESPFLIVLGGSAVLILLLVLWAMIIMAGGH